jgi:L-arabinose isomerase
LTNGARSTALARFVGISADLMWHLFDSRLLNGNQTALGNRVRGILDNRIRRRETGEHLDAVAEIMADLGLR